MNVGRPTASMQAITLKMNRRTAEAMMLNP